MDVSKFLPLISAILVSFLGFVVLIEGKEKKINRIFFMFIVVITIGLFSTFMMLYRKNDVLAAVFWDRLVYVGVVFIPSIMYHFGIIVTKSDIRRERILLYLGYILSFFFLFLIPTGLFVSGAFVYEWGVHTKAATFHNVFIIFFTTYILLWFFMLNKYYNLLTSKNEKERIQLIFLSFFILTVIGSVGFLPAYGVAVYPFSYLSGVFFSAILAYAILKHQLFDIKVLSAEILVLLIGVILTIRMFLAESFTDVAIEGVTLFLSVVLGIFLIRSVKNEVKRREHTEMLVGKLRVANQKLKELDEQKSDFLSIASHQLRTPLTAIKGYTSMIQEGVYGKLNKKTANVIDKIFHSSQRLVFIVNDLLDMSRIEQGRFKYSPEDVNVVDVLKDVIDELRPVASEKGLDFGFKSNDNLNVVVSADPGKIRQVFSNIIDNSIKYTASGYVNVFITESKKKNTVIVRIEDSGMGIEKDSMKKIFEKFSRAQEAIKAHTGGSGIGLYVAKEIMRAHKGNIWAESEGLGKGAAFYIEIPLK